MGPIACLQCVFLDDLNWMKAIKELCITIAAKYLASLTKGVVDERAKTVHSWWMGWSTCCRICPMIHLWTVTQSAFQRLGTTSIIIPSSCLFLEASAVGYHCCFVSSNELSSGKVFNLGVQILSTRILLTISTRRSSERMFWAFPWNVCCLQLLPMFCFPWTFLSSTV